MAKNTRSKALGNFIDFKFRLESAEKRIKAKMSIGRKNRSKFDDHEDDFYDDISKTRGVYQNMIRKGEYADPEIVGGSDYSYNGRCCIATKELVDAIKKYKNDAKELCGEEEPKEGETSKLNPFVGGFLGCEFQNLFAEIANTKRIIDDAISLLKRDSSSIEDINAKIREYNAKKQAIKDAKERDKTIYLDLLHVFWDNVLTNIRTAIGYMDDEHVGCHKNHHVVTFDNFDKSPKITLAQIETVADGQKLKKYPTPKNYKNFRFLSWKDADGNPFDPKTAAITRDMEIFGRWNIGTTIEWLLDGESKAVHDMGEFEEGTDCTTAVQEQLRAYNTAWGHMAVVPDIGSFDCRVDENNYDFAIKGTTKTFVVKAQERTKTTYGWTDNWTDVAGSSAKVKYSGKYPLDNLPVDYRLAFENGYRINQNKTKTIFKNTESPDVTSITADTVIKFDTTPMYRIRFLDWRGEAVGQIWDSIPIGTRWNVDSHAPAAWPAQTYVDDNKVYGLKIDDEYTHKGEIITVSADTDIIPNYERINKATVIFSLNGKDDPDGVQWGAKNHKYEDEDAETSFSTYSEINSPEYPSVLEAVMATATSPLSRDDKEEYENSIWDNSDLNIGWYLGDIKITTGSLIKTAPGDNILVFKGKVYQKALTVFCFSPDDKQTLQEHGIEWQTKTIDGKPYEGYIKHTYDKNPEFPEAQQCGPYYTIWGETVDKYTVNFCRLEEAFAGYIIPKIVSEDESSIYIQMDTSTNLVDSEIVDKIVPTEKLKDIIEDKFSKDKEIVIRNSSNTNVAVWGRDVADSRIDSHIATTINNKQYAVINFNPCGYNALYLTYVYEIKDNAEQRYKNYPAYESYTSLKKIDDDYKYELIVVRNITESEEQWGRGDIVDPIYSSQNQQ